MTDGRRESETLGESSKLCTFLTITLLFSKWASQWHLIWALPGYMDTAVYNVVIYFSTERWLQTL